VIHVKPQRGYILLPVVLLITLVATSAFLLNNESALDTGITASNLEAKQAEHVAKAGLNHALWQAGQQGCGPYTNLTNEPLDTHSYTTTLTTGLGSTSSFTINVDQDTWIRSDQPTVNYANDSKLHIRFETGIIERPMFRYDLSPIAANSNILSATAWFYVSKEHPEGPVDIHMLTTDWTETDATWDTMGDRMDATIQATIPTQSAAGVWVAVNLTSQVQAWVNGSPNFGITLNSLSEGTHGDYASIEAGQKPYLEVIVGTVPNTPATLQSVGKLASGIGRTVMRDVVPLYQQPSHRMLQQATVKDVMLSAFYSSKNYGDYRIRVSSASGSLRNSLIQFDLSALPAGARVLSAELQLHHTITDDAGADAAASVHRVQRDWIEGTGSGGGTADGATWNTHDGSTPWTTQGGDYDPAMVASSPITAATGDWESWDISTLVRDWVDGSAANHGLLLKGEGTVNVSFASKEDADAALHPKLSITYACECGQPCVMPQGSGNVLMVVSNPWNLVAGDVIAKSQMESWGYTVSMIQDDDSSSNFDAAVANNDVVYVSHSVSSGNVGTKLTDAGIGVVLAKGALNDEFGISSNNAWTVDRTIDLLDTSHYITQPFPVGSLAFKTADMSMQQVAGNLASGAQVLAEVGGVGGIVVLDTGATMEGGGTAAGRRVLLPTGKTDYDWNLTHNGRLIVQRALAWGMRADAVTSGKQLLLVVSNAGSPTNEDDARKALIESWGYLVELIDDSDNQTNFDTATAANDVVFVSGTVSASALGTKLKDTSLGVVNEEIDLHVEFGFASNKDTNAFDKISITDNTHEITTGFNTGWLTIATSSEPLQALQNTLAPGLQTLAETWITGANYKDGLVLLDSGDELYGGGSAAGRRVQLPWGGSGFDYSKLNDNGKTIMKRSIEWAGSVSGPKLPIAHWKLDENSGTTTAVDSAGGHDGTLTNGPVWTGGQLDGALDFDGTNDHITVPHDDVLSLSGTMSFSAWINASSFGSSYQTIVAKDDGGAGSTYWFGTWRDELAFGFFASGSFREVLTSGLGLQAGNWYHLAATFNDSADEVILYIDGIQVHSGSLTFSPTAVAANLTIGRSQDGEYWRGRLDDVRIYDDLLGADEIAELATLPGPSAHWRLDETSGTTAIDSEGGHHGTLTNGPAWIPGQVDGGLEFDGTDDFINVPHDDALSLTTFSISAWIKPTSLSGWKVIVNKGTTTNAVNYYLATDNDEIGLGFYNAGWVEFNTTSADLTSNQWYHVLASYDDASRTGRIYLDGMLIHTSTVSTSPLANSDALTIGRSGIGEYWTGIVDDVRIYNRVLSDSEAADIAGGGGGGGGSSPLTGCDGTFRDEFSLQQYDQNDGTLSWATHWEETGETTDPTGGDIQIDNDTSDFQLMLRDDGQTVMREADLSEAGNATLSLDYRRENLQNSGDYVAVEVSYNGGSNWTELDRFAGNADDATYTSTSYPLDSAQLSTTTRIRFKTPGNGMNDNNQVWFDNVQIQCTP
jgi:hypothetical protein